MPTEFGYGDEVTAVVLENGIRMAGVLVGQITRLMIRYAPLCSGFPAACWVPSIPVPSNTPPTATASRSRIQTPTRWSSAATISIYHKQLGGAAVGLNYSEIQLRRKNDDVSKHWESILAAEGLKVDAGATPAWHRASPVTARRRLKGAAGCHVSVQLPADWSANAQPCLSHRTLTTELNREIATANHSRLSDYVWNEVHWAEYPPEHRLVMEAFVIDGPEDEEIARRVGISVSGVYRILRMHRWLAGLSSESDIDT